MRLLQTLIICFTFAACEAQKDPDAVLKEVFTEQEMVMVNQIIDYYDAYVWSQTDTALPIEKAYQQFFNEHCDEERPENTNIFFPPREDRVNFLHTVNREALTNLFYIQDSLYLYSRNTGELTEIVYYPFLVNLKIESPFIKLLENLSYRDGFYAVYYDRVQRTGFVSPTLYSLIFISYAKDIDRRNGLTYPAVYDFSKKEERLACIFPFLFPSEPSFHEFPDSVQIWQSRREY